MPLHTKYFHIEIEPNQNQTSHYLQNFTTMVAILIISTATMVTILF